MRVPRRPKLTFLTAALAIVAVMVLPLTVSAAPLATQQTASANVTHPGIDCSAGDFRCTEVHNSDDVFGHYVGHDEPSDLFYSNAPGSGNRIRWQFTLPKDPSPNNPLTPGKAYNFELRPAFWFGMAMCDTQSFPEQISTCTPDSDKNIVDPAISPVHAGEAFMELQFYPPGWAQQFASQSCAATTWCAALTIDSLSVNPVTGKVLNPTCAATTGLEYVNFAYVTKNGIPQAAPNPVQFNPADQTPDPNKVLFMNQGDNIVLTMNDTAHGLHVTLGDQTTGGHGSMTASAANGFGQVKFAPSPSTKCTNIPYDFHPMYSTTSEKTRVTWASHSYNIAYSDEIGHFDFCNGPGAITPGGTCPAGNTEGNTNNSSPTDVDNVACFPTSSSLLVQVSGCNGENDGYDGVSYQPVWPDGNTRLHPTALTFSSPLTGSGYNVNYNRMAFETDTPSIEQQLGQCDPLSGLGCTNPPLTDSGTPANFYPFFSIRNVGGKCIWQEGNHIPGSKNDFGQLSEYGALLQLSFTIPGGGALSFFSDYRQILSKNPCPA